MSVQSDNRDALEIEKIRAEINKLLADTSYINRQNLAYPVIVTATATLALVALVKTFL